MHCGTGKPTRLRMQQSSWKSQLKQVLSMSPRASKKPRLISKEPVPLSDNEPRSPAQILSPDKKPKITPGRQSKRRKANIGLFSWATKSRKKRYYGAVLAKFLDPPILSSISLFRNCGQAPQVCFFRSTPPCGSCDCGQTNSIPPLYVKRCFMSPLLRGCSCRNLRSKKPHG